MPEIFNDQMIEDVMHCIRLSDVVSNKVKASLIGMIMSLRQPYCATVPSCGACPSVALCEGRIGAILNGEPDATASQAPRLRLVRSNAA